MMRIIASGVDSAVYDLDSCHKPIKTPRPEPGRIGLGYLFSDEGSAYRYFFEDYSAALYIIGN
jgi:hypothetical protein